MFAPARIERKPGQPDRGIFYELAVEVVRARNIATHNKQQVRTVAKLTFLLWNIL